MTDLEKKMKEANDLADRLIGETMKRKFELRKWLNKGLFTLHVDNKVMVITALLGVTLFIL
jgi:hypothetical protein|tara:strand:- start:244 stop:426 length:183 start_codon:yes stop_codon:yes gene_type:complete